MQSRAPSPPVLSRAGSGRDEELGGDVRGGDEMADEQQPRRPNKMQGPLPPDDGMKNLRQKLHEIRTLAVSTEEKARRMHYLMTHDYMAHKAATPGHTETNSNQKIPVNNVAPFPVDPNNPYNIRQEDLEPVFSPLPVTQRDTYGDADESMEDDSSPMLGCIHYKRNVKVQCFDCRRWFPCRRCHDSAPDLPFEHQLNRKKTQNMLCMLCKTPQPAAETCANCGEYAAWYYCPKCKLWDNDNNKRIYHCDDCGICRVGEGLGKDYVHCRRCNVCISISTSASHPCIERATEGDCPLCLVRLFESTTPVVSLPCGHYMHGECYKDLMAVTYKCPVCSKSAVNMDVQWRKLDDEILAQPMPDDDEDLDGLLANADIPAATEAADGARATPQQLPLHPRRPRTVWIGCNDCGGRCWTPFHWLGLKCQVCDSYNTNQMAPTAQQETDTERIIRQQQQHHRQHDFTGNSVLRDAGIGADEQPRNVDNDILQVPTSPSQAPFRPQSPGRRYFVQEEDPHRSSFTTPRFPTPSIPNLPSLPEMPGLPRIPHLPNLPNIRNLPNMPGMPELPHFSPYEMLDAVSRSLSPMRYYRQGMDMTDHDIRRSRTDYATSPTSIRSDPLAGASISKHRVSEGYRSDDMVGFWGEGEDADESIRRTRRNENYETSSSASELSDMDLAEDDPEDGDDDDEEMELFGHR